MSDKDLPTTQMLLACFTNNCISILLPESSDIPKLSVTWIWDIMPCWKGLETLYKKLTIFYNSFGLKWPCNAFTQQQETVKDDIPLGIVQATKLFFSNMAEQITK